MVYISLNELKNQKTTLNLLSVHNYNKISSQFLSNPLYYVTVKQSVTDELRIMLNKFLIDQRIQFRHFTYGLEKKNFHITIHFRSTTTMYHGDLFKHLTSLNES